MALQEAHFAVLGEGAMVVSDADETCPWSAEIHLWHGIESQRFDKAELMKDVRTGVAHTQHQECHHQRSHHVQVALGAHQHHISVTCETLDRYHDLRLLGQHGEVQLHTVVCDCLNTLRLGNLGPRGPWRASAWVHLWKKLWDRYLEGLTFAK
eukprot:6475937-Amphidinium_carterae.2